MSSASTTAPAAESSNGNAVNAPQVQNQQPQPQPQPPQQPPPQQQQTSNNVALTVVGAMPPQGGAGTIVDQQPSNKRTRWDPNAPDVPLLQAPGARAAGSASSGGDSSSPKRIYVGSLHYDLKENDLQSVFAAFGPVESVCMSFDPATGGHRGFCFVDYQTVESAEYALANLNGFELAGRPIKVGRPRGGGGNMSGMSTSQTYRPGGSTPHQAFPGPGVQAQSMGMGGSTKIYVGNVDSRITTDFLTNIFRLCGHVVGAEMKQDPNNPHKRFGFIQYARHNDAKNAVEKMANDVWAGRKLIVDWAQDQSEPVSSVSTYPRHR